MLWEGLGKGLRAGKPGEGFEGRQTATRMPNVAFGTGRKDGKTIQNQNRGPMLLPLPRKRMPGERYCGRTGWLIVGRTQPERKKLLAEGLGKGLRAGKGQPGCLTLLSEPEEKTARRSPKPRGPMLLPLPRKKKAWRTLLWEDRVDHWTANTA